MQQCQKAYSEGQSRISTFANFDRVYARGCDDYAEKSLERDDNFDALRDYSLPAKE